MYGLRNKKKFRYSEDLQYNDITVIQNKIWSPKEARECQQKMAG